MGRERCFFILGLYLNVSEGKNGGEEWRGRMEALVLTNNKGACANWSWVVKAPLPTPGAISVLSQSFFLIVTQRKHTADTKNSLHFLRRPYAHPSEIVASTKQDGDIA